MSEIFNASCAKGDGLRAYGDTSSPLAVTTVWKECITDPAGVIIYKGGKAVTGPRKSRYRDVVHSTRSYIMIYPYVSN